MNRRGTLSVFGLWQHDQRLFDLMQLPEDLDRETAIDSILLECASLETRFPHWEFLQQAIGAWSKTRVESWARMLRALTEEYDPLHNYDRHETWTNTGTGTTGATENRGGTSNNRNENTSTVNRNGSSESVNRVSGFNEDAVEHDRNNTTASDTTTTTGTDTGGNEFSENLTRSENNNNTDNHEGHMWGNIGVTQSSEMLAAELSIRKNDLYNIITTEFKEYFCVMVY